MRIGNDVDGERLGRGGGETGKKPRVRGGGEQEESEG